MNDSVKKFYEKDGFYPVLISILLHLIFIVASLFIKLHSFNDTPEAESMHFKLSKVSSKAISSAKKGSASQKSQPAEGVKALDRIPRRSVEERVKVEGAHETPTESKASLQMVASGSLDTIIFESQKNQTGKKVAIKPSSAMDYYQKSAEKSVHTSPVTGEKLLKTLSQALQKIDLYAPENMSLDPEEGMPGFTPMQGVPGGSDIDSGLREEHGKITDYESVDDFLDIEVYKYEDPSDGGKYFMVKIFAKPGNKTLKVMPKEIIFTIDCSLSINAERLDQFKKGIAYCLKNLNQGDVFNIVAFKDKVSFFSSASVPATPDTIKKAEKFVEDLTSNRATDVYAAFSGIVQKDLARKPSNIVLISDGKPTYGIVNSRELINSVTKLNDKVRPVFAYSGGSKVNRYLLDFIAYQNRGWSQFIKKARDISSGLSAFYDKIKDPVFINLRYRMSGVDEAGVYPRSLPDFYRNAEFTLYGRYDNENKFSMQLLGDIDGKTKELVFSRALSEAKPGSEDIKTAWAFNKVYHLIGRMTEKGESPEIRAQISQLSRQYGIQTPYSVELETKD